MVAVVRQRMWVKFLAGVLAITFYLFDAVSTNTTLPDEPQQAQVAATPLHPKG
jgi:hypothetical protein